MTKVQKFSNDGIEPPIRYTLPGEDGQSRVKECLQSIWNVIRYGNTAGMPRKCTDEMRKVMAMIALAATVAVSSGVGIYTAVQKTAEKRMENFMNPAKVSTNVQSKEATLTSLLQNDTGMKLVHYTALDTNDPKMVVVQRIYEGPEGERLISVIPTKREDYENNQELLREVTRGSLQGRRYPVKDVAQWVARENGIFQWESPNGSFWFDWEKVAPQNTGNTLPSKGNESR